MTLSPYSSTTYGPTKENNTWYKMIHMVPKGAKVFDIGCSAGNFGRALQTEKDAQVDGIDITESDVNIAKKYLNKAWVMDIEKDTLPPDQYDTIIFADVLEHMKDPVKVLQRVKKLLKADGSVVFSIPNMAHISVRLELLAGKFSYTETGLLDHTHLHFYEEAEVRRIFQDAGYVIESFDCTTFDYPKQLIREKLSQLGLRANADFFELATSKQATIFEYVGIAKPSSKALSKPAPRLNASPVDEVAAYIDRLEKAHESKLTDLQTKIQLSDQHIQKLDAIIVEEKNKNSQSTLTKIYHKLKRK